MAEINFTAYKANVTPGFAGSGSVALNSRANNEAATCDEQDNSTNRYLYDDLEIVLGSFSPAAGAYLEIYLLPAIDDTNLPDPTPAAGSIPPVSYLVATIQMPSGSSVTRRCAARGIVLPPTKFRYTIVNRTGATLAASGHTFRRRPYNENVA